MKKIAAIKHISFSILGLSLLTLASCSKHDDDKGSGESTGLLSSITGSKSTLVDTVPSDAVALGYFDLTTSGYARLKASPYEAFAGKMQGLSSIQSLGIAKTPGAPDLSKLETFLQGVVELKLNAMSPAEKDAAKSGVYFLTVDPSATAGARPAAAVAFYCAGASGFDMNQKLNDLEAYLQSKNVAFEKSPAAGPQGFSIKFPELVNPSAPFEIGDTLYAYATSDKLSFSTNSTLALQFFAASQPPGLSSTQLFKDAMNYVSVGDSTISTLYLNVKQLAQDFAGSAPEAERAKITSALATLPVESVVANANVDTSSTLKYSVYCPVKAQTDVQKEVVSQLAKAKASTIIKSSPAASLLFLSLDSALIKAGKDVALLNADPQQQAQIRAQLAVVDQLNDVGLGVQNASGASPFPEIYLLADSADPAATQGMIKMAATAAGGSSGMPTTKWQTKDVTGVKVDYMMSPLGVGLYLGSVGSTVFAASSEAMATSIIASATGKAPSLEGLTKDLSGASLFATYLDFAKLYQLIDSVRGTMAMFTGGKASFDTAQFDALKNLGVGTSVVTADSSVIKVTSNLRPAIAQ